MNEESAIIILAAGQGKRMGSALPKVLVPLKGRPMIEYVLDAISRTRIKEKPYVVVGVGAELVRQLLGSRVRYAHQTEQKGTAHAVMSCRDALANKHGNILVLYGDMPFITPETIEELADAHGRSAAPLTMITTTVPDFEDWRAPFYSFGRIVRTPSGEVDSIVEFKDCTESQKEITEVNPSFFCFDAGWLWKNIGEIGKNNAQGEYYLTDLVGIATRNGDRIVTISADPKVAVGINTVEQLKKAEELI